MIMVICSGMCYRFWMNSFTPWTLLSRKPLLDRSPWLRLEDHHLRLPDGREISDWLWVNTPEFINVAAVMEDGRFLCFRQTKYAAGGVTLAMVGGYLEEGEDPRDAAERELREETGCVASSWESLGDFAVDGNRGCGRGHFFLATGCRFEGHSISDDLEEQEEVFLTRAELRDALLAGRFGVVPWVAALSLALLRLEDSAV